MLALILSIAFADGFDHTHAAFDAVLEGAVTPSGVDYDLIRSRKPALDAYVTEIAEWPVNEFSPQQQLAFWINAYNAHTLKLILDEWPVASIRDLDGGNPWDARTFRVGGQQVTLNDMEHRRVRRLGDARIHAAVNCASKGCPPLRPDAFTANGIGSQLNAAARGWVAANAVRTDGGVAVNNLFEWYSEDFAAWATAHDATSEPTHAATLAFLAHFGADVAGTDPASVTVFEYDWTLNDR